MMILMAPNTLYGLESIQQPNDVTRPGSWIESESGYLYKSESGACSRELWGERSESYPNGGEEYGLPLQPLDFIL